MDYRVVALGKSFYPQRRRRFLWWAWWANMEVGSYKDATILSYDTLAEAVACCRDHEAGLVGRVVWP